MNACSGVAHKREENPKRQIRRSHLFFFFFYFSITFSCDSLGRKILSFPFKNVPSSQYCDFECFILFFSLSTNLMSVLNSVFDLF